MNKNRTIVVAGIISGALLSASAAFAVTSGLFSSGRADQVGTFQAIEHVFGAQSTTTAQRGTKGKPSTGSVPTKSDSSATANTSRSGESTAAADGPDRTSVTTSRPAAAPAYSDASGDRPDDDDAPRGASTTTSSPPTANSTTSTSHPEDEHEYEDEHEDDGSESDD